MTAPLAEENCESCGICLLSEDGHVMTDDSGRHRYCDDCPADDQTGAET